MIIFIIEIISICLKYKPHLDGNKIVYPTPKAKLSAIKEESI